MYELQPAAGKVTASDAPVLLLPVFQQVTSILLSLLALLNLQVPKVTFPPRKSGMKMNCVQLNQYHLLSADSPPRHAYKTRKSAHECFGKGNVMRLQ